MGNTSVPWGGGEGVFGKAEWGHSVLKMHGGWREDWGALGDEEGEAWECGSMEGRGLGDRRLLCRRQEAMQTWGLCLVRREV